MDSRTIHQYLSTKVQIQADDTCTSANSKSDSSIELNDKGIELNDKGQVSLVSANEKIKDKTVELYNTLTKRKEVFVSLHPDYVSMYTCGPTVYHYAHIGNLKTYIFEDILKKMLTHSGYAVNHVMNITDVGHLQSDADEGQDKMAIATAREHKTPWEIAKFYEEAFFLDCNKLHIKAPSITCRATEHIPAMIAFVQKLETLGYTYNVDNNIYFNTAKFENYTAFARLKLPKENAKGRVEKDIRKQNPQDFVLWFSQSKFTNQIMKWDSPWGEGFPGWHIECSAMAMQYLGEQIDIHCGGTDHIPIHHTNEIAQAESLTGKKWVNYWLHSAFLVDENGKMSKSSGGFITLKTLTDIGFEPEHFRYFCLSGHYRRDLKFSYPALEQAREKYEALKIRVIGLKDELTRQDRVHPNNEADIEQYKTAFWTALRDDMHTAEALNLLTKIAIDKKLTAKEKLTLLFEFDEVLSLGIPSFQAPKLSKEVEAFLRVRAILREQGYYEEADKIRSAFAGDGVNLHIEDAPRSKKDTQYSSNKALLNFSILASVRKPLHYPVVEPSNIGDLRLK